MSARDINLRQLRAFVAVATEGSFVAAADTLHFSQPALSQSIRQLESQIGGRLLDRTTRRVSLTPLGASFLPDARQLLRQFDTMLGGVKDIVARQRGRVVLTCLPSLAYRLMPAVIAESDRRYPDISVLIKDANAKGVVDAVLAGDADLAIGSHGDEHPDLEAAALLRDRFHVVMPRTHPLATMETVPWHAVAAYPFIGMTAETGVRQRLDQALGPLGIEFRLVCEVSHLSTVNGMLEEGLGITALAGLMLPHKDHGILTARPLVMPTVDREVKVIWRRGFSFSPAVKAFVQVLFAVAAARGDGPTPDMVRWAADGPVPTLARRSEGRP